MEFKEIKELIKLVNHTELTDVEIENKDVKIRIRKKAPDSNVIYSSAQPQISTSQPVFAQAPQAPAVQEVQSTHAPTPPAAVEGGGAPSSEGDNLTVFKSPMIGTFYRSASPEDDVFVNVGDYVQKGQVLCIIEAMKLFNEIESEVEGKIVKILTENAQPVEYEQGLFLIDPAG